MVWNTFIHERNGLTVKTRTQMFIQIESPRNSKSEVLEINKWLHIQSKKTNTLSLIHYCIARFGQVDLISNEGLKNSYELSVSDKLFQSTTTVPENQNFDDMSIKERLFIRYDSRSAKEIEEINKWINVQSYIGMSIKLAIQFFISRFGYRDIEDLHVSKWLYIGLHFDKLVENGILKEEEAAYLYLANSSNGALKTSPSLDLTIPSHEKTSDENVATSSSFEDTVASPTESFTKQPDVIKEVEQPRPTVKEEKGTSPDKKKVDLTAF